MPCTTLRGEIAEEFGLCTACTQRPFAKDVLTRFQHRAHRIDVLGSAHTDDHQINVGQARQRAHVSQGVSDAIAPRSRFRAFRTRSAHGLHAERLVRCERGEMRGRTPADFRIRPDQTDVDGLQASAPDTVRVRVKANIKMPRTLKAAADNSARRSPPAPRLAATIAMPTPVGRL